MYPTDCSSCDLAMKHEAVKPRRLPRNVMRAAGQRCARADHDGTRDGDVV
jgi:hypothetical protein